VEMALMSKLISCSNHSAFFDWKYCWFFLESIHLFYNPLQTRNVVMVLVIRCQTLLEYISTIGSCCLYVFWYYHIPSYSLGSIFYQYMVVFLFNTVIYVFLLLGLCILIVRLPWLRFFRAFSSVVRQMPG